MAPLLRPTYSGHLPLLLLSTWPGGPSSLLSCSCLPPPGAYVLLAPEPELPPGPGLRLGPGCFVPAQLSWMRRAGLSSWLQSCLVHGPVVLLGPQPASTSHFAVLWGPAQPDSSGPHCWGRIPAPPLRGGGSPREVSGTVLGPPDALEVTAHQSLTAPL